MPRFARSEVTALEAIWLAATVFSVAFVSALGILLAVLGGMHAYYEDRRGMLVVYAVLGAIGAGLELSRL
jgi:hypothetical protein